MHCIVTYRFTSKGILRIDQKNYLDAFMKFIIWVYPSLSKKLYIYITEKKKKFYIYITEKKYFKCSKKTLQLNMVSCPIQPFTT